MNTTETYSSAAIDCISTKDRSDIMYWCDRLSVSPFSLFHLIKTVGNSVTKIEEFIHTSETSRFNDSNNSLELLN